MRRASHAVAMATFVLMSALPSVSRAIDHTENPVDTSTITFNSTTPINFTCDGTGGGTTHVSESVGASSRDGTTLMVPNSTFHWNNQVAAWSAQIATSNHIPSGTKNPITVFAIDSGMNTINSASIYTLT